MLLHMNRIKKNAQNVYPHYLKIHPFLNGKIKVILANISSPVGVCWNITIKYKMKGAKRVGYSNSV